MASSENRIETFYPIIQTTSTVVFGFSLDGLPSVDFLGVFENNGKSLICVSIALMSEKSGPKSEDTGFPILVYSDKYSIWESTVFAFEKLHGLIEPKNLESHLLSLSLDLIKKVNSILKDEDEENRTEPGVLL